MINFQTLRDNLRTALSADLGTYTYQDGSTTPAIYLDEGNMQYPLPGTKVTGLECLVVMHPEVSITPVVGGADRETMSAAVILKQWDAKRAIGQDIRVKVRNAILLTNPNFQRRETRIMPTVQIVEEYRVQLSLDFLVI